jgi:3-deoxy-manno-octulosonate cytidylyltransferase (CMP-KDO synthetase)
MGFIAVIPARYGSTRLPGKPLLDIHGQPMVWHVVQRAMESDADRVIVATDDQRIMDAVIGFGGECVMTDPDHPTGTDRLAEVARLLDLKADAIVVNVQGDEPLLPAAAINQVAHLLQHETRAQVATLCEPLSRAVDINDPNQVKVVFTSGGRALYFSRAPIPGHPEHHVGLHFRHIGLYGYRAEFLHDFSQWAPTPLEQFERLEQLRALDHHIWIQVAVTDYSIPPGVDTEADLTAVRKHLDGSIV